MNSINVQINFGISIILCANYIFNEKLKNTPTDFIINVTLDDSIFDGCRNNYGLEFKQKMYDIMRLIFTHKNIKVFDEHSKKNIFFEKMMIQPPDNFCKYKINTELVNYASETKNITLPDRFITITTKVMNQFGTEINLTENNKQLLFTLLNRCKLPIIIIGEKNIKQCPEYDILKPYSIYKELTENLINYLDFTIESTVNNHDLQDLSNTIYILNNSKLNLYLTSTGAPMIGLSCSNNILGTSSLFLIDKKNFINENNSNINFVRTLKEFFDILKYKIYDLNNM